MSYKIIATVAAAAVLSACAAQESSRSISAPQVNVVNVKPVSQRIPVSVGKFDNRSNYMRGVFSDNTDRLGSQAKTILETHLHQTGQFSVLNRDNLNELAQEAGFAKSNQAIRGARYVITGDVVEFGRKEVGDHQLFGILGQGKSQVAYAKVNLNVIDVASSQIVYSTQGAGEYSLSNREVLGFGSTASYDSTLNGKVLDLAIREAVNNLAAFAAQQ